MSTPLSWDIPYEGDEEKPIASTPAPPPVKLNITKPTYTKEAPVVAPEPAPATTTATPIDWNTVPYEGDPEYANGPAPVAKPDYPTLDGVIGEPLVKDAITAYYAPKGYKTYDAMVKQWKRDMRYSTGNTAWAAAAVNEIGNAQEAGDINKIENIRIMRDAWDRVPGMFSKGGDDIMPALYENIEAGITDPANLLTMGAGVLLAPAKSMAVKLATTAAVDAMLSTALDYTVQQSEIEVGLQTGLDEGRLATAGVLGATIPMTIAGTTYAAGILKDVLSNVMAKRSANLQAMPQDAKNFNEKFKLGEEAEAMVKGISFIGNKNEYEPWIFLNMHNGKEYRTGGNVRVFTSQQDAVTFAENNLIPGAVPGQIKVKDLLEGSGTTSTPWRLKKLEFKTVSDAKNFVKKHGQSFGSKDPGDYTWTSNEVAGVNGGVMQPVGLLVQQNLDQFYRRRQIIKEAKPLIEANMRTGLYAHAPSAFFDDAVRMAENAQNSQFIAGKYLTDGVFQLARDPNNPNVGKYVMATDTPALGTILVQAGSALRQSGNIEPSYGSEIFRYMLAKRALAREADPRKPINTGVITRDARAFVRYIENDPVKAPVYLQAAEQIKVLNRAMLQFGVDHNFISAPHMQDMLQISDLYMPFRRLEDFGASWFGTQRGSSADTTRKFLSADEKIRGRPFLDPLEAYKQEMFAFIRNASENRANLQMYRTIEAAGGPFANRFIERVTGASKKMISPQAIERALRDIGIHVNVTAQNADMLAVWVKQDLLKNHKDVDFVYENGKPIFYRIKDLMLADAMVASGPTLASMISHVSEKTAETLLAKGAHNIGKAFRSYNELYSVVTTHDPGFLFGTAMVADSVAAAVFNPAIIPKNWSTFVTDIPFINAARGFSQSMDSKTYQEFMANGGGLSGMRSNITARKHLIKHAKESGLDAETIVGLGFDSDSTLLNKAYATLIGSTGIGTLAKKAENAVRYNTYINAVNSGKTAAEASNLASKSSIDFRLRGTSLRSAELQRTFAPFTRAMFNALYQTNQRMFTEGKDSAARWFKLGVLTLPMTAYLYHLNKDDPQYKAIPDHAKDMYWFIPMPQYDEETGEPTMFKDGFLKIRKPHELAIPANAMDYWFRELEKSEEGKSVSKLLGSYITHQIVNATRMDDPVTGFLPPALAAIRQITNNSIDGTIPLNAARDEGSTPAYRGNRPQLHAWADSPTFRNMLDDFNIRFGRSLTPKDMEVFMSGTFGVAARYSMDLADMMYTSEQGNYKFHFSSLPLISRIYQSGRPIRNTGLDDKIYAYEKYVTRLTNDLRIGEDYGKVENIKQAMEKLNGSKELKADPKYQKYAAAAEIISKVSEQRNEFEKAVVQLYETNKSDPMLEDKVDHLFEERNKYLQIQVTELEKVLKKKKIEE